MTEQEYTIYSTKLQNMIKYFTNDIESQKLNECEIIIDDLHILLNKIDDTYHFSLTRNGVTTNNSFKVEPMDDTVTEEYFMADYILRFVN
jgi:hypothetical protein